VEREYVPPATTAPQALHSQRELPLRLTLAEGAIQPWTRITGSHNAYQKLLAAVAERYGFLMSTPIVDLSAKALNVILYGTGAETFVVEGKKQVFPGVIPDLMAKHLETRGRAHQSASGRRRVLVFGRHALRRSRPKDQ
jgi:excinuclease UvrABC ATPase subunit